MALVKHDERYGPYMTANNAPSPYVATASQNNWGAFRAFSESLDDDISFTGLAAGTEQWVQIKLDAAIRIWAFRIACRTTVSAKDAGQVPKNFVVQGSVDGTTFEDIQAYTDVDWSQFTSWNATNNKYDWADAKKIEISCAKEYQYYRFQFGECQSVSTQKTGSMTPTSSNTVKLTLIDLYQVEGDAGAVITGIRITYPPVKKRYKIGEALDTAGMEVMADMSDGTAQAVTDYTLSGYDSATVGQKTVTVTYQGHTVTFTVTVCELSSIAITTPPAKVQYNVGDALDLTGMVVTATYSDGVTEGVTDYTVSGFDSTTAGTKTVIVTYQGKTATFDATISAWVEIVGIEVSPPEKIQYMSGEPLDTTGMSVSAVWTDGSRTEVSDYTIDGFDSAYIGICTITIFYTTFQAAFDVTVVPGSTFSLRRYSYVELPTEKGVVWESSDEYTAYVTQEGIVVGVYPGDVEITGTFADGTVKTYSVYVTLQDHWEPITYVDEHTSGYITYEDLGDGMYDCVYHNGTEVDDLSINATAIFNMPMFSTYRVRCSTTRLCAGEGSQYDEPDQDRDLYLIYVNENTGGVIRHEFIYELTGGDGGESRPLLINYWSGEAGQWEETFKTLKVEYLVESNSIRIASPPLKTKYYLGEELDTSGMSVELYWDGVYNADGEYEAIWKKVKGYQLSGYDSSKAGKQVIGVSYAWVIYDRYGNTVNFTVNVIGIKGIEIASLPDKTVYNAGDEFDPAGMVVQARYTDNSVAAITGYTISGFDSSTAGSKTVTVTYQEFAATFVVMIAGDAEITGIEIASFPDKKEYIIGEGLDASGLIVNLVYSDGSRETTEDYTVTGFDSSTEGAKTITVTHRGFSATFEIIVRKQHTVTFKDWDGRELGRQNIIQGSPAVAPDDPTREGFTFTGWDTDFSNVTSDLTVTALYTANVIGIEITAPPAKLEYAKGEELDAAGLIVSKVYADGRKEGTTDYTLAGFNSSIPGEVNVTASYLGFTAGFTVTILQSAVVRIEVLRMPVKLYYGLTDAFESTGLVVEAVYSDGTREEVSGYTLTGFDSDSAGIKAVTVSYQGFTVTYTLMVMEDVTVIFYDLYGNKMEQQKVHYGHDAVPPDLPVMQGYTGRWDKSYENVKNDITCKTVYTVQMFTVTFKDHDGITLDAKQVRHGDDATPPESPTRDGYLFAGWDGKYTDITADIVITATYTKYAAVTGIELQAAYTVVNGETVNIPYKVLPETANNKGVSITVSDSTVIDTAYGSGWIICEAINTGEAVITVTSTENSSISASCTVTVVADDVVTGISLYPPELLLQKGKTEEIAVSVTGGADIDESVVWTSSNSAVATIKSGKVKGIAEGAATITARLKTDASFYATCSVTVEDKKDFIIESYKKGSRPKPITIHSVSGKFKDITGKYIDGESMVIKESICDSQTLKLGGCIANSFEVLILDERLHAKAPTGEIQVYQTIEGNRVELFNGIIYKAERVGDSLKRKLVAYDKLYSKGNKDMAAWFKKLKLPMTVKQFRTQLFKKIGIKQASVVLDIDMCTIMPPSYKTKRDVIEIPSGNVVDHIKEKIENYAVSTSIKASDIIRDLCEASGTFGWMNRKGVFEYIDIEQDEKTDLDGPVSVTCAENYYQVKCIAVKVDDQEWFEGGRWVEMGGETVTPDGIIVDTQAYVSYKKEVENATYVLDEGNFIVQTTVIVNPLSDHHMQSRGSGLVPIMQAVHSRATKPCQQFECQRRFNPYDKLGAIIEDKIKKETSTGKNYTWNLKSIILSRTIKGSQSMLETISAKNGPFNASNDTSRKNIKMVNVKQELNSKKLSMLDATKMTGIGMTKSEFDAADIIDSENMTYYVRFD